MLEAGLGGFNPTVTVLLSTPDQVKESPPSPPAVTIFLYQVGICGERRNAPRSSLLNGAAQRPPLPLELRFMVTPWTQEASDAYRIIGAIAQIFYDHAVWSFGELLGDDVWAPDDTVEIVMEPLPVEQHYDIWEPTELPYRLSLTYLARVIGIDSAVTTGASPVAVATFPKTTP
jgi:hypothetical protein